jgi:hypothetical protein
VRLAFGLAADGFVLALPKPLLLLLALGALAIATLLIVVGPERRARAPFLKSGRAARRK